MIAIQISLYPLQQNDINNALDIFWDTLKQEKVRFKITPLSTLAWSKDEEHLYGTVFKAYKKAKKEGPAVMVTTTVSAEEGRIEELLDYFK